jgi:hypothetical protein
MMDVSSKSKRVFDARSFSITMRCSRLDEVFLTFFGKHGLRKEQAGLDIFFGQSRIGCKQGVDDEETEVTYRAH